ncbi:hypothetical protein VTN77DRAFT_5937 [Rasamsonia byssochlamydoides]|uniref:uncharacterized protein n=1 Tax=Rasamsonia byssochlamydoides TaxID=89139 RepID=UPI00374332D0
MQLFFRPPYPDADFSGKTVIVTGSNVGLGKEAVRHFVRLNAKKVIMAVRSIAKGEAAKAEIEAAETKTKTTTGVIMEVWELDYARYDSVKAFAARAAATLDRIDVVVLNAGIATQKFEMFEDNESSITVNVVSTTMLVLLLLPILRSTAEKYRIVPVITITCSAAHTYTAFPERKTPNALATLNDEKTANMYERYPVSKLLQLLAAREIAERTANTNPFVIINTLSPGLCYTDLNRNAEGMTALVLKVMRALLAWTAEEGSRTLVHATTAGPQSHGIYISGCKVQNNDISPFVVSLEGRKAQKKVWSELVEKLERIQPGVTAVL